MPTYYTKIRRPNGSNYVGHVFSDVVKNGSGTASGLLRKFKYRGPLNEFNTSDPEEMTLVNNDDVSYDVEELVCLLDAF